MPTGYYFTNKEQEQMSFNGYSIVQCPGGESERDKMAQDYKQRGYRVRLAYSTTRVRGIYNYYLWVKIKPTPTRKINTTKHDKELVGKLTKTLNKVHKDTSREYYTKTLEASKKRVIKYIEKVVKDNNLNLNESVLDTMEKTNGNLGSCKSKRYVYIQKSLLDSGVQEDIDSVVAHEITHCIKETKGHDKLWKAVVKDVNAEVLKDVNLKKPFQIHQFSNETLSTNEKLQSNYKYVCKCTACNKAIFMNKKESWMVRSYKRNNGYWNSHCPKCGASKENIIMEVK